MILYFLLAPPPLWRTVILPVLFLPPDFLKSVVRDFSGAFFVISLYVITDIFLCPFDVGFNFLIGI